MNTKALKKNNLKRIIKKKNITQALLANKIGVTPQYLNRIIKSKRGISDEIIDKICDVLNIKPAEFYIESDTPIINNADELIIIKTLREIPESKEVLLKISEAYTSGDKKENTGENEDGSHFTVQKDNKKRNKIA